MISFGPILSRRLGKSLGINNIVSPKICSYACIYCQAGKTMRQTIEREKFFEPELIYKTVGKHLEKLSHNNSPDYLTFVSNGEPTLDINLGKSIQLLKNFGYPIAVITNASLLQYNSVHSDLGMANWVSVKMDAGRADLWQKINNPSPKLNYEEIIKNISRFASGFEGKLCTETMIIKGVNDNDENFIGLAQLIKELNPVTAYLAVPTRPPSCKTAKPADPDMLNRAWQIFNDRNIKTEFLTGFEGTAIGYTGNIYEDILNITTVHPLREDMLFDLLKKDNAGYEVVESLIIQKLIRISVYNGNRFFLRDYHPII
ncbi:MAG: radical SAM protein [Bacteroidales bacterium]